MSMSYYWMNKIKLQKSLYKLFTHLWREKEREIGRGAKESEKQKDEYGIS